MPHKLVLYYNDLVYQPSESFLHKDFGQMPYVLADLHDAALEYWIAAANPNSGFTQFRGRRVRQFAKNRRLLPARLDRWRNRALYHAIDRAKEVTHLVMFLFTPATDLVVARRARRHGTRIILKLDTNTDYLDRIAVSWHRHERGWRRRLGQAHHYRELLRIADVVICETSACEAILRANFLGLDLRDKLVKTFSGLSERWLAELRLTEPHARRHRSIVVSGRISSHQKHSETILAAGPPPAGWTIDFVGEVDDALQQTIDRYRLADQAFDDRYRFHGAITDKRAYFALLMQAQALLLNSRGGEGFPNVFAEAHHARLMIVTSDISGADDATGGGRWGMVYAADDAGALRHTLAALPARIAAAACDPVPDSFRRQFLWEYSLDQRVIRRLFELEA